MKDTILQSLKFTTALATINLVFWFVVAGELERVIQIDNFGILIAFPIFIAAWVQYRRRSETIDFAIAHLCSSSTLAKRIK